MESSFGKLDEKETIRDTNQSTETVIVSSMDGDDRQHHHHDGDADSLKTESITYTDEDGIVYDWDAQRKAWFPHFTEELLEIQQTAYGTPSTIETNKDALTFEESFRKSRKNKEFGKQEIHQEQQLKPRKNPNIYVSGLPLDVTIEELKSYFEKCGIIREDFETGQPKIKLYKTEEGLSKGDAMISYWKEESVDLASQILDQSEFRPNYRIHVEQATFDSKTLEDSVDSRKRKKIDKQKIKRHLTKLEKKLGWYDTEKGRKTSKYTKTILLKHMFTPEEIEEDPGIIIDLKEDIRMECEKLGPVTSIHIFEKSEEGVCSLKFREEDGARQCVELMNGRWFGGRQIEAQFHDGNPMYALQKTHESIEDNEELRLKNYAEWLENQN